MRRERKRLSVFTRRALVAAVGQASLFGLLGSRLYRMQVIDGARYATLAKDNRVSARLMAPPRGEIHDRNGTLLAGNKPHWRALLMVEETADTKASLAAFARLIPLDPAERERIAHAIQIRQPFIPVLLRDYLSWEEMAQLAVNAPELPGIVVDVGTTRFYPFGPDFAHLVGYVGPPARSQLANAPVLSLPGMRVGKSGVELERNQPLTGLPGVMRFEVDALGRVIRDLSRDPGMPGETVRLHVDAGLQRLMAARLGKEQSASAVVLDLRNGAVMAMGSTPSFDPTLFDTGVPAHQWKAWITNQRAPLLDKAGTGLYAPGSTFKPVVALAALSSGAITGGTRFFCPGYFELGHHRFWCWNHGGHGFLDVTSAICQSCDVFFYHTALATGIDQIAAMARRLGIGAPPPIDLPGFRAGFVPTREWREASGKPWTLGETVIQGIGQGFVQATPFTLALMAARVATGRAISPRVTAAVGAETLPPEPTPDLGIPEPFLALVRRGMREVVNNPLGTAYASRLFDPNVQMAGKTGTAQVFDGPQGVDTASLPWKFRPNALFIAFAPAAAPRYALSVVVEHGNEGADAAAPIARDLMEAVLARDPANRKIATGDSPASNPSDEPPT
ncbi:MAG TPA: penicillin-binding protein 2 [Acetobacteraceae bacterium]|nr:penicillin-binding protein 2 [Acetobacteraceae bacterium]